MENKNLPIWLLAILSWVMSVYFIICFHISSGFPPKLPLTTSEFVFLLLGIFFLFMPFFSKIKIPKIIELERSVADAKNELREFKDQTANMFSILSTSISTINTNTTNIIMPNRDDLAEASKELDQSVEKETPEAIREIEDQLILDDEDRIMALARLRIKLEYLLRELLLNISLDKEHRENELRRYSLTRLFREFRANSTGYEHLEKSIYYVTQICNASIH